MTAPHGNHAGGRHDRASEKWRLQGAMAITTVILVVEIAGGIHANSLALLSDAGHVFTDLGALVFSYAAFLLSTRPRTARRTFGWYRIEILAALVNGVLLTALAAGIFFESARRFGSDPVIRTLPMMVAASIGLAGNLLAAGLLSGGRRNLNIRGALLHVIGDTLSSIAVLATGGLISLTGWTKADAVTGVLIAIIIVIGALRLLKESVDVLLEAAPSGIELVAVSDAISRVDGVLGVHDLHIWSITSDMPALSGHVVIAPPASGETDETLNSIKRMLSERFSIGHSTLQVESPGYQEFGEIHD